MANQVLINNLIYLERLLCDMQDRITRMSALTNSIQKEGLYYVKYEMPWNLLELPAFLKFHPILRFFSWLCFSLYIVAGVEAWPGALPCALVNLYFTKKNRSILTSILVGFFGFPFILTSWSILFFGGPDIAPISFPMFCVACALAYGITFFFAMRRLKQANEESEIENDMTTQQNEIIRSHNQEVQSQCRNLNAEVQSLQNQVAGVVNQMGYPPDYVCLDAVRFFIHALRNDRADSFRRLIDLYESNNYRRQMLSGQKELANLMNQQIYNQERMSQLLAFSNGLSAANLAAQIQTQAEVRSLDDSLRDLPSYHN